MIEQRARAEWTGDLESGHGSIRTGGVESSYSFASRFQGGEGVTPEELIGAAHAGCFSMALSLVLGELGHTPDSIRTTATVRLDAERLAITRIVLDTEAVVAGIGQDEFREIADAARDNCPVSKALAGVEIELEAALLTAAQPA
jgi:lipoyl-dependent peroxiredoxin